MIIDYISAFPHNYSVEVIRELPPADKPRPFYYPGGPAAEGGRDGLLVAVRSPGRPPWIGVFAYGKVGAGKAVIASSPDLNTLCVVSAGQAYFVRADEPTIWSTSPVFPIADFRPLPEKWIILLVDDTTIGAFGPSGMIWRTKRLSWDGVSITSIGDEHLEGEAWDPTSTERPKFRVDLSTGEHRGGSTPAHVPVR
jgi:hypothetical protein